MGTLLDVLAVLLCAFGAAAALFPFIGWAATGVAGVVILAAVRIGEAVDSRKAARG